MNPILIVEDDQCLNSLLKYHLGKEGYPVISASTIKEAKDLLTHHTPLISILDINLPDGNGYNLCTQIKKTRDFPIIFLTANESENDIIKGYDLGAEDYITKPFSINVFKRKLEVILNRTSESKVNKYDFNDGELILDFSAKEILLNDKLIIVANSDFQILKTLVKEPGRIFSKALLLDLTWKDQYEISDHAVAASIYRLRSKLESSHRQYIKTVYGMGYVWIGKNNIN